MNSSPGTCSASTSLLRCWNSWGWDRLMNRSPGTCCSSSPPSRCWNSWGRVPGALCSARTCCSSSPPSRCWNSWGRGWLRLRNPRTCCSLTWPPRCWGFAVLLRLWGPWDLGTIRLWKWVWNWQTKHRSPPWWWWCCSLRRYLPMRGIHYHRHFSSCWCPMWCLRAWNACCHRRSWVSSCPRSSARRLLCLALVHAVARQRMRTTWSQGALQRGAMRN